MYATIAMQNTAVQSWPMHYREQRFSPIGIVEALWHNIFFKHTILGCVSCNLLAHVQLHTTYTGYARPARFEHTHAIAMQYR